MEFPLKLSDLINSAIRPILKKAIRNKPYETHNKFTVGIFTDESRWKKCLYVSLLDTKKIPRKNDFFLHKNDG